MLFLAAVELLPEITSRLHLLLQALFLQFTYTNV